MESLRVTSAELVGVAGELESSNESLKSYIANLENSENQLAASWKGDASTAFHNNFEGSKEQIVRYSQVIAQYTDMLREVAKAYDKMEENNVGIIG